MAKKNKTKGMRRRGKTSSKQTQNSGERIVYKPKNGGVLHMFAPGHSGNPHGRPRKFVSTLKGLGYSNTEVVDTMKNLMSLSEEELENIQDDTELSILERTVAKALLGGNDTGNLGMIETVITRAFGSPRQILEQKVEQAITDNRIDLKKLDVETLRKLKAARIK